MTMDEAYLRGTVGHSHGSATTSGCGRAQACQGGGSRQFRLCVRGGGGERARGQGEKWGCVVSDVGMHVCACRLTQSLCARALGEISLQHVPCFDLETHSAFCAMLMSVLAVVVQQRWRPCSGHVDGWWVGQSQL